MHKTEEAIRRKIAELQDRLARIPDVAGEGSVRTSLQGKIEALQWVLAEKDAV